MTIKTIQKSEFEMLKQRLLLRELDEVVTQEAHALIIQEAGIAAKMASQTLFPSLVFPALFDERVRAVVRKFEDDENRYWDGLRGIVNSCE